MTWPFLCWLVLGFVTLTRHIPWFITRFLSRPWPLQIINLVGLEPKSVTVYQLWQQVTYSAATRKAQLVLLKKLLKRHSFHRFLFVPMCLFLGVVSSLGYLTLFTSKNRLDYFRTVTFTPHSYFILLNNLNTLIK